MNMTIDSLIGHSRFLGPAIIATMLGDAVDLYHADDLLESGVYGLALCIDYTLLLACYRSPKNEYVLDRIDEPFDTHRA